MVRGFAGGEPDGLKIFFDGGAKVVRFEGATKTGEDFALRGEKEGVGNGFEGFEEVEGFGSRPHEGVADTVSF